MLLSSSIGRGSRYTHYPVTYGNWEVEVGDSGGGDAYFETDDRPPNVIPPGICAVQRVC